VDRSACYMARYIAKNIVSAGLARQGGSATRAYAIGVAEPVSVMVDAFGTENIPEERITALVRETFSLTPKGIIEALDLRQPIYKPTRRLRPFRTHWTGLHLGTHGPRRCSAQSRGLGFKRQRGRRGRARASSVA